ncbi:MAG: chemotaxis protein CheW [Gammaproteobacteria bacterium]|nr:MAG: chemotaxis protein CheW [Gammaproteobacteria bacterium]
MARGAGSGDGRAEGAAPAEGTGEAAREAVGEAMGEGMREGMTGTVGESLRETLGETLGEEPERLPQGGEEAGAPAVDACWKRIGVWARGGRRCPELEAVVHCANCPRFARAAQRLLERPPLPGHLEAWAERLAQPPPPAEAAGPACLVFRLGPEWLALPTAAVAEVVELRPVRRIPHRANPVLRGLVAVHGELLLCVSLRRLLGIRRTPPRGDDALRGVYPRLLLLGAGGRRFAFAVSEILGIHHRPQQLEPAPVTAAQGPAPYLRGMFEAAGRTVACLDEAGVAEAFARAAAA